MTSCQLETLGSASKADLQGPPSAMHRFRLYRVFGATTVARRQIGADVMSACAGTLLSRAALHVSWPSRAGKAGGRMTTARNPWARLGCDAWMLGAETANVMALRGLK